MRGSGIMGKRQENGDEKNISHDWVAEQTRWAEWPNSGPISYGLMEKVMDVIACKGGRAEYEVRDRWELGIIGQGCFGHKAKGM